MEQLTINTKDFDLDEINELIRKLDRRKLEEIESSSEDLCILSFGSGRTRNVEMIEDRLYYRNDKLHIVDSLDLNIGEFPLVMDILEEFAPHIKAWINKGDIQTTSINVVMKLNGYESGRGTQLIARRKMIKYITNPFFRTNAVNLLILASLMKRFYLGEEIPEPFTIFNDNIKQVNTLLTCGVTVGDIMSDPVLDRSDFTFTTILNKHYQSNVSSIDFLSNLISAHPNMDICKDHKDFRLLELCERKILEIQTMEK